MTDAGTSRPLRWFDSLLAIAMVLIIAVGVAIALASLRAPSAGSTLADSLNGLAFHARALASGDASDLSSLQDQTQKLHAAIAANPSAAANARITKAVSSADAVVQSREAIAGATEAMRQVRELVARLLTEGSGLSAGLSGAGLENVNRALERLEVRAERLQLDVSTLAAGTSSASQAAQRLAESSDYIGRVIGGLQGTDATLGLPKLAGADADQRLKTLEGIYAQLSAAVRNAVNAAPALPAAQAAARSAASDARAAAAELLQSGDRHPMPWIALVLALGALAAIAMVWTGIRKLTHSTAQQAAMAETQRREHDRNQQAILRLLDELSSLADGDLTVQATVTEDITGAIADSINYAVDALRGLVTTINQSSIQLDGATRQTQALAAHLAKASGAQSKQIGSATDTAAAVAAATEEVSGNAERAADVARHSVDVAHKGGDAVRRTIDGMNAIRETIQETSKRIKRLGESSQEIGNIVELINDIAEQTNILALNASIQASMAGEAGRGFAVVADEVQRLAERAANATKQIEVLVRTIQTDTNEAVVSMERSTTDVVGGALLAENAGAALEEIEQVSNQIASLVQNIFSSSRQQASAAGDIARNMQVLKEISTQTADSTSATSAAIAKLAELSADMRKSASGFRLPAAGST